jgi:hypothetical protein
MNKRDNLTAQQKKAAQLLCDNEFGLLSEDGKKLPIETVAEMAGVVRSTIYEWKKLPAFREYMNDQADGSLDANRAEVYAAIMKLVRGGANGLPSVRALDLYMRRFGLLRDVVETREDVTKRVISEQERQAALERLDQILGGSNGN